MPVSSLAARVAPAWQRLRILVPDATFVTDVVEVSRDRLLLRCEIRPSAAAECRPLVTAHALGTSLDDLEPLAILRAISALVLLPEEPAHESEHAPTPIPTQPTPPIDEEPPPADPMPSPTTERQIGDELLIVDGLDLGFLIDLHGQRPHEFACMAVADRSKPPEKPRWQACPESLTQSSAEAKPRLTLLSLAWSLGLPSGSILCNRHLERAQARLRSAEPDALQVRVVRRTPTPSAA